LSDFARFPFVNPFEPVFAILQRAIHGMQVGLQVYLLPLEFFHSSFD